MDWIKKLMKHHTEGGKMIRHFNGEKDYVLSESDMLKILDLVNNLDIPVVSVPKGTLPTKEDIISEGAKQVNDWLEGNTEREKQHYLIGFRRSYEYVLRCMK